MPERSCNLCGTSPPGYELLKASQKVQNTFRMKGWWSCFWTLPVVSNTERAFYYLFIFIIPFNPNPAPSWVPAAADSPNPQERISMAYQSRTKIHQPFYYQAPVVILTAHLAASESRKEKLKWSQHSQHIWSFMLLCCLVCRYLNKQFSILRPVLKREGHRLCLDMLVSKELLHCHPIINVFENIF